MKKEIMEYKHKLNLSGVKRLYIDGLIIKRKCPKCGRMMEIDYTTLNYFTYEDWDQRGDELAFQCKHCDIEYVCDAKIQAEITIKITSKLKIY